MSTFDEFLSTLTPVPPERYAGISTTDLLTYVVLKMQEYDLKLVFEPIVVAAHHLFPTAFSLVGFPDYPDASRVGRTLLQCRPKYRGLIKGGASSQFVITELGYARAAEVAQRLAGMGSPRKTARRANRPRALIDRFEHEVRNSNAFAAWRAEERISEYDFYHFLHLLPGSSRESVCDNFAMINGILEDSQDADVRNFLAALKSQYIKELL